MGKRRILVIGSQCNALPRLSFLPKAAKELYAVMTDPDLGGCEPALPKGGLILDPTASEAKRSIKQAFVQASQDDAILVIAFVGHGEYAAHDFYLLPRDGEVPPDSETGIHLVQFIKELHRNNSYVDGLVVLLDACYSGVGAADAAAKWVTELTGSLRFEVLAAVADRPAADGCFSRNLADILRNGIDTIEGLPVGERVRCEHARKILIDSCKNQLPQLPSYNADEALYLGKNAIYLRKRPPWYGTSTASEIERLTAWFQPTPQLEQIVETMNRARCVALFGGAGTGKSTLAAALARPEITAGKVPSGLVHGILFMSERTTSELFADELATQLGQSLSGFTAAAEGFHRSMPPEEFAALDAFERQVGGPLHLIKPVGPVRLIVDGLDRVTGEASHAIQRALNTLASDPQLPFLRLLVTARPDTPGPPLALSLTIDIATTEDLHAYLTRRSIDPTARDAIIDSAEGNWLMARLLADLTTSDSDFGTATLPAGLANLYTQALGAAGATNTDRWRTMLRPVLGVLAAAGVGPVLPLKLFSAASGHLGGPSRSTPIHDVLFDLRGFVARSAPGTENEQVGLFHQTLADYLFDPSAGPFAIDAQEPHAALVHAIETLAPIEQHDPSDPLHHYAEAREPLHLWAVGQYERALRSLKKRESVIPAENRSRWQSWYSRAEGDLGADHVLTLTTRINVALCTSDAGDARTALQLSEELLADQERVLGVDHPYTLTNRGNIATLIRDTGDVRKALRLLEELLPDQKRLLGPDHPHTLTNRGNIATFIGEAGDVRKALQLSEELLTDKERVLGSDHPDTLLTRANVAVFTGQTGDRRKALQLLEELLADMERVLGPDHPYTLKTRAHIADKIGKRDSSKTPLQLLEELLPDQKRVLGPDHPDTLKTRAQIATKIGDVDHHKALRLLEELLPDQKRLLGPDHPDTLLTRGGIAALAGQVGDGLEALRLFKELLPDVERALGPGHPVSRIVRRQIRFFTVGVLTGVLPVGHALGKLWKRVGISTGF